MTGLASRDSSTMAAGFSASGVLAVRLSGVLTWAPWARYSTYSPGGVTVAAAGVGVAVGLGVAVGEGVGVYVGVGTGVAVGVEAT